MAGPEAENPQDEGEPIEGELGVRLSLYDHCQIFAALRWRGTPIKRRGRPDIVPRWQSQTVANAFGVSEGTISQIKTCLMTLREPKRYQRVAEEFHALGEQEFMRVYYTLELRNRLIITRAAKLQT